MIIFILASIIIVIDQISKYYIIKNFELGDSVNILNEFIKLTYIKNPGGAFSIFSNFSYSFRMIFFIVISILVVILIILYYNKIKKLTMKIATGLLLGGTLGNLIDRIKFGEVIDFIDIGISKYRWPTFNLADVSICTGVIIIIFYFLKYRKV
jgi:signal peptidase II